jgi:hypothetical protein
VDNEHSDALVSEREAAKFLGCTVFCLRWRTKKLHLPWVSIGRLVKYRHSDLEALVLANRVEVAA